MIALGWVTNIFQRGAASMGRLNYILNAKPRIGDRANRSPARPRSIGATVIPPMHGRHRRKPIRGEIEFRHLTFTYPHGASTEDGSGGGPVLHDINLQIPAGSTLAIVGPTGSGKSTLASLVARLWDAPPGHSLHRRPLHSRLSAGGIAPRHRLRAADTYLFSDTLRENIAFGVDAAIDEAHLRSRRNRQRLRRNPEFPAALRHDGGRARHHAFRRPETTHLHRARDSAPSAES